MKIKIIKIRKLLESKLKKINLTAKEAKIIANEYVIGELKGKHSHGIFGFIRAYGRLKKKKRGYFRVVKNKSAYAYIAGNHDVGQVVADYAIKLALFLEIKALRYCISSKSLFTTHLPVQCE